LTWLGVAATIVARKRCGGGEWLKGRDGQVKAGSVKGRTALVVASLLPALVLGVAALPSRKGIVIVVCEVVAIVGGVRWEVRRGRRERGASV
jgi:hypothetical protein